MPDPSAGRWHIANARRLAYSPAVGLSFGIRHRPSLIRDPSSGISGIWNLEFAFDHDPASLIGDERPPGGEGSGQGLLGDGVEDGQVAHLPARLGGLLAVEVQLHARVESKRRVP